MIAKGIATKEIRIPVTSGIAASVFNSKATANIADPYADPRFNKEVDRATGYRTESILAMPILNKHGDCIGVTQVLNKRGGKFTARDETRLGAFTAQIAIAPENAQLFEDVLREKNYNDSILRSTSDDIITLDAEDLVLTANDAALRVLERDRAHIVNRPVGEIFRGSDEWMIQNVARVKEGGQREIAIDMELKFERKSPASVNLAINPRCRRGAHRLDDRAGRHHQREAGEEHHGPLHVAPGRTAAPGRGRVGAGREGAERVDPVLRRTRLHDRIRSARPARDGDHVRENPPPGDWDGVWVMTSK